MASSRSSDGGERSQQHGVGGVIKRSPVRHSETERPRDSPVPIPRGGDRGGERRKRQMLRACLYFLIMFAFAGNVFLGSWLYRTTENRGSRTWRYVWGGDNRRRSTPVLRFEPSERFRMLEEQSGLDKIRSRPTLGIRPPRLAVVLGRATKDPTSVLLFTLLKGLEEIGYNLTIYAVEDGESLRYWKEIGGNIYTLGRDSITDWSLNEGVILCSAEAGVAISSLMKDPFRSVPVMWVIQEDTLGERLSMYAAKEWDKIISGWRRAFSRADVIVFPDFSLPLLYSTLDTGNFFVVPGSPVDVWAAESYGGSHSKYQLRKENGIQEDDVVIAVIGSCFLHEDALWDSAAVLQLIGSQLMELSRTLDMEESFQVIFLSRNSTGEIGKSFEEGESRRRFPEILFRHFALDGDTDGALLMADIVLYGSMHDEQSFPILLIRAMILGIPIVAPDLPIIEKYVTNGVDGLLFHARDPRSLGDALRRALNGLSFYEMERSTAAGGKLRAKNMQAWDCVAGYAKLLENLLQFPSYAVLPSPAAQVRQRVWEWRLLADEKGEDGESRSEGASSILDDIAAELDDPIVTENSDPYSFEIRSSDWADVTEMELREDAERREAEELAERSETPLESWGAAYAKARRVSKTNFEAYERDEGELEQVGRHVRIYETYAGAGAWQFLHSGALYRGLSLGEEGKDSRFGDVPAVERLPLLKDSRQKEILCEFGGLLAIANEVDSIHKTPWIGFQSWRAAGRKVSLSAEAEEALTEALRSDTRGDVIYYWAKLDLETRDRMLLDFWPACDILNNGHCREVFQETFRRMYDLPRKVSTLPPMPATGHWSTLHSWVMPTPSFMEFILFSRMFLDSLDAAIGHPAAVDHCPLGSSTPEKESCFCRVLELLVNVWAYHGARRMVHVDPSSGEMQEQHPIHRRRGSMWAHFFNATLLKEMDEDLAESAADGDPPRRGWLWPLTGEVYSQLAREMEREVSYRAQRLRLLKEDEERRRRLKHGRYQRPLG